MRTVTVMPGPTATLLVSAGDGSVMINNADAANDIYIGDNNALDTVQLTNTVALTPGQSLGVDGTVNIYGQCQPGQTAVAQIIPSGTSISLSVLQAQLIASNLAKETGGNLAATASNTNNTNFTLASGIQPLIAAPSSTIAKDIKTTGAPGLRFTNSEGINLTPVTLTPGLGVVMVNNAPVNQMGYEALLVLFMGSGVGTNPFATVIVNWFDATTGLSVEADFFVIAAGNGSGNALTYYLSGPCKGDIMNMQIIDLDGAQNMTLQYAVNQNSHIYARDRLLQPVYGAVAPIGFTNPNGTPGLGLLAVANPTITPGAISSRLIAAFNGKVGINVDARSQANNISYKLADPASLYSGTPNGEFWSEDTPAGGGQTYSEVVLPNGPVQLSVTNRGGTGNVNPMVSITKLEY